MSRGGYALLEEKMMKEKMKERQEAAKSDPSIVVSPPSPPKRHEKWKKARVRPNGEYTSKEACDVANKIDSLVKQTAQGAFEPVGREDILTMAIGKPEHPGRGRGVGGGVGLKQYFGSCSRKVHNVGVVTTEMIEAIREEVKKELQGQIEMKFRELQASMGLAEKNLDTHPSRSPIRISTKGSNAFEEDMEDCDEIPYLCKLYVEGPRRLVAFGNAFLGTTIHHKLLEDDNLKVGIERVKEPHAPLPVATDEVKTVGQALNHFVQWPRRLVVHPLDEEEEEVDPIKSLWMKALDIKNPIPVQLDGSVIGKSATIPFYICRKDVTELLGGEMLCVSILQLWLMYIHRICT